MLPVPMVGLDRTPPVDTIALGADFDGRARRAPANTLCGSDSPPAVLTTGILEPRKRQAMLLEVCESLWAAGARFSLDVVGRVNPHFGKPIRNRVRALTRAGRPVRHHETASDELLRSLYERAAFTVFPSHAEGLGLPVLESLWMGVPCLASDIPSVRECAQGGGCRLFAVDDDAALRAGMLALLEEEGGALGELREGLRARALPTWEACANQVLTLSQAQSCVCP